MRWFHDLILPIQGSTHAPKVDNLFMAITVLCIFFFILIGALVVGFAIKYRRRSPDEKTPQITHHLGLELTWSIVPLFIVMGIFVWGFKDYMAATVPPNDAMEIIVTGEKWLWTFEYPDGMRSVAYLHVPVNKPVKLVMMSKDVLHSFFIPEFRIKADVLPNRYTEQWFHSTVPGVYQVQCTEYCGKGHSAMNARINVDTPAQYEEFLEKGDPEELKLPPSELGKMVYENFGCITCHSLDGTRGQGPSWKGIYGREEKMADGRTFVVDDNYIRRAMLEPQAEIVQGFEAIMPTYQGLLRDRHIRGIIEFIKLQR